MPLGPMVSITVPVFNEQESVAPLIAAIRAAMHDQPDWELVLVDDGSTDDTVMVAAAIAAEDARIHVVELARNYGQSTAMQAGFDFARGEVLVSLDGDLQNDPEDIPRLLSTLEQGFDLVTGYRQNRQDFFLTRKVPSWVANRIIQRLTGVPIRDNGCSLKAYRRELIDRISLYSDMHRFIPAMASVAGARIAEIPVRHHPRRFGSSKYGLSRIVKVLADLTTIKMIRSFREQPLVLFSLGSLAATIPALIFSGLAILQRFEPQGSLVPLVLFGGALLWFGLAMYLLMLGLVAEAVLRQQHGVTIPQAVLAREVFP